MNIIFAGSKGKTGSVVCNYLKEKGFAIDNEVNVNEKDLSSVIKNESIIIDFTNKTAALKHANICLQNHSHFICGTTGIKDEDILQLQEKAQKQNLHFIFKPNFSLGLNKLIPALHTLSDHFPTVKITESHHISKLDLPSGTALLLKKELQKDAPIESLRTTYPTLDHKISFENDNEEITITHKVKNKLAYATGVEMTLTDLINQIKEK